jgi:hypothetical protein
MYLEFRTMDKVQKPRYSECADMFIHDVPTSHLSLACYISLLTDSPSHKPQYYLMKGYNYEVLT